MSGPINHLTETGAENIRRMREDGHLIRVIAEKTGFSRPTVQNVLNSTWRPRNANMHERIRYARVLDAKGVSYKEISKVIGVSGRTIHRYLMLDD